MLFLDLALKSLLSFFMSTLRRVDGLLPTKSIQVTYTGQNQRMARKYLKNKISVKVLLKSAYAWVSSWSCFNIHHVF